jgi:hypothetical protein
LSGPAAEIFKGLNVIDSEGEFVGIVQDTMEADDVLDAFIVEDERGEMVTILMEDVRCRREEDRGPEPHEQTDRDEDPAVLEAEVHAE